MPDPKNGTITFHYRHQAPKTVQMHTGVRGVPFAPGHQHGEAEITVTQGSQYTKLSVTGDVIRLETMHPQDQAAGQAWLVPTTTRQHTDKALAKALRQAIKRALGTQAEPDRRHTQYAVALTLYIRNYLAGPHGTLEREEENISPRANPAGMNFDFGKSPFKEKQTRLHVESSLTLGQLATVLLFDMEPLRAIVLNAEQTPVPSLLRPFNEAGPPYRKIILDEMEPAIIKAYTAHPNNLRDWYDTQIHRPHGTLVSEKMAKALRHAVSGALADDMLTEPEAKALARFQETLFSYITQFSEENQPTAKEAARREKVLLQLAEDVTAASLPPKPKKPRTRG